MSINTPTSVELNKLEKAVHVSERDRLPTVSIDTRIARFLYDLAIGKEGSDMVIEAEARADEAQESLRHAEAAREAAKNRSERFESENEKLNRRVKSLEKILSGFKETIESEIQAA